MRDTLNAVIIACFGRFRTVRRVPRENPDDALQGTPAYVGILDVAEIARGVVPTTSWSTLFAAAEERAAALAGPRDVGIVTLPWSYYQRWCQKNRMALWSDESLDRAAATRPQTVMFYEGSVRDVVLTYWQLLQLFDVEDPGSTGSRRDGSGTGAAGAELLDLVEEKFLRVLSYDAEGCGQLLVRLHEDNLPGWDEDLRVWFQGDRPDPRTWSWAYLSTGRGSWSVGNGTQHGLLRALLARGVQQGSTVVLRGWGDDYRALGDCTVRAWTTGPHAPFTELLGTDVMIANYEVGGTWSGGVRVREHAAVGGTQ